MTTAFAVRNVWSRGHQRSTLLRASSLATCILQKGEPPRPLARASARSLFLPGGLGHERWASHYPLRRFASSSSYLEVNEEETNSIPSEKHHVRVVKASNERAVGNVLKKNDVHLEETKRLRLSDVKISEVLRSKHEFRWVDPVISEEATVKEAIVASIEGGLSAMMVLAENTRDVVGLLTTRDLLRIMASGIKDGDEELILNRRIGDHMTPISQVIYARPDETVGMCRTLMAKLGIKCLPILSKGGRVEGLLTTRDMSDYGLSAKDKGGKQSYLNDVSERVGLSSNISMADPPLFMGTQLALEQVPLFINYGSAALPHPFKTHDSVGRNRRDIDQSEFTTDMDLSEDAFFVTTVDLPDSKDKKPRPVTYMGVADGVGSWREYGVDPRHFSRQLMLECVKVLEEAAQDFSEGVQRYRHALSPSEVMEAAYSRVCRQEIVGSCTVCIAVFDNIRHQLHFSNLGDSGIIVLRHIDSGVAGALKRDRLIPRSERKSDLRLAFCSQQQLQAFNHPYQLGWTGDELAPGERTSFKKPRDSCTTSVHLRRGDIIILATDGLFDNVDIDDICAIALDWEQRHGFIRGGDTAAREHRWRMGNSMTEVSAEYIEELAQALCIRARENSLNSELDSPFAILAKENDIMWSGGMPDDCTVVALHVVGRDSQDQGHQLNK